MNRHTTIKPNHRKRVAQLLIALGCLLSPVLASAGCSIAMSTKPDSTQTIKTDSLPQESLKPSEIKFYNEISPDSIIEDDLSYWRTLSVGNDTLYATIIDSVATPYYFFDHRAYLLYIKEAYNIRSRIFEHHHPTYISSVLRLTKLCISHRLLGEYNLTDSVIVEAIQAQVLHQDTLQDLFYQTLLTACKYYRVKNNGQASYRYAVRASHVADALYGPLSPQTLETERIIFDLRANSLTNDDETISLGEQVLEKTMALEGKNADYFDILSTLIELYKGVEDWDKAIHAYLEELDSIHMFADFPGIEDDIIYYLGLAYEKQGMSAQAIKYRKQTASTALQHIANLKEYQARKSMYSLNEYLNSHLKYAKRLNDLAESYHSGGMHEEALKWALSAVRIIDSIYGEYTLVFMTKDSLSQDSIYRLEMDFKKLPVLITLASIYRAMGDYGTAMTYADRAKQIAYINSDRDHYSLYNSVMLQMKILANLNRYDEAVEKGEMLHNTEAWKWKGLLKIDLLQSYAMTYLGRGLMKGNDDDLRKARNYYANALDSAEGQNLSACLEIVAKARLGLASTMLVFGQYEDALHRAEQIEQEAEECGRKGYSKHYLVQAYQIQARSYREQGQYDLAEEFARKTLDSATAILDKNHPDYHRYLAELIDILYLRGKSSVAQEYMKEYIDLSSDYLRRAFQTMSTAERYTIWQNYERQYLSVLQNAVRDEGKETSPMVEYGLNGTLFAKGLLLNSEISLRDYILHSPDSADVSMFDSLLHINRQIEQLRNNDLAKKELLEAERKTIERTLAQKSYGTMTKRLSIRWEDVRSQLKKGECAIEFVNTDSDQDTSYYAAYIMKPNEQPRWIPLRPLYMGEIKQLPRAELSQWLWGELAPKIGDTKTIYFSPAGELYSIGIEYLPDIDDTTQLAGEHWDMYRLSSCRELALREVTHSKHRRSATYGGLKFNNAKRDHHQSPKPHLLTDAIAYVSPEKRDITRDTLEYLKGSLTEVLMIDSTLRLSSIDNKLYIDTLGTEASFKGLSGGDINLIHMATHGFYWNPDDAISHRNIKTIDLGLNDDYTLYTEEKALNRTGLMLAGADLALLGGELPDTIEDGILTAREIANLDLSNTDMVVLSACKTGLGEVSGEGVFGLQRGFKKAGVQSLMVSLWSVNDSATQILMTAFYAHWLNDTITKREALARAQHDLRKYTKEVYREETISDEFILEDDRRFVKKEEHPFDNPIYWGAFILLDAFD